MHFGNKILQETNTNLPNFMKPLKIKGYSD